MSLAIKGVGAVDPDRGKYVIVRTTKDRRSEEQPCAVLDSKSRRAFFITISTDLTKAAEVDVKGQKLWVPLNIKDKSHDNEKKKVLLKIDKCWARLLSELRVTTLEGTVNFLADNPGFYQLAQKSVVLEEAKDQPKAKIPVKRIIDRSVLLLKAQRHRKQKQVAQLHHRVRADLKPQHVTQKHPEAIFKKKVIPAQAQPVQAKESPKKKEEPKKRAMKGSASVPNLSLPRASVSTSGRSLSPAPTPENNAKLQELGDLSSRVSAQKVLTYIADHGRAISSRLTKQNSTLVIHPKDSGLKRTVIAHVRQDSQDKNIRRPYFYMTTNHALSEGGFKHVDDLVDVSKMCVLASLKPKRADREALFMQQKELRILTRLKGKKGIAQLKDSIAHRDTTVIGGYRSNKVKWIELLLVKYSKGDLWTYLESTRVSRLIRLRLAYDIACGIAAMHDLGIVHRDLKPWNVLIGENSSGVFGVLTDFGIAVEGHSRFAVKVSDCQGTRGYIAPEVQKLVFSKSQVDGKPADIWSLGRLYCDLFTKGSGGIDLKADQTNLGSISQMIVGMMRTKPQDRSTIEGVLKSLESIIKEETASSFAVRSAPLNVLSALAVAAPAS
jgi:hypothetical protein